MATNKVFVGFSTICGLASTGGLGMHPPQIRGDSSIVTGELGIVHTFCVSSEFSSVGPVHVLVFITAYLI